MGRGQPALHGNNTQDVLACSCQKTERGGTDCPPRPPAEFASPETRGRHTCHSAGGARNFQSTPRISTMSMSYIIRDKATGVTYMDTVTTSIGRVALSGPDSEASSLGPTIKDVTSHE